MKTPTTLLLMFACFMAHAFAGTLSEAEATELKNDINAMMKSFEAGDVRALLDRTHEALIEQAGGKEPLEKLTQQAVTQMLEAGVKFLESELGAPTEVYPAGKQEVCFVPRTSIMEVQGQKVKSIGFMIAARPIGTRAWKYLDGSALRKNPRMLARLFPDLDPNIVLPANTVEVL